MALLTFYITFDYSSKFSINMKNYMLKLYFI